MCGEKYGIKLVAVVVSLYLILAHTTLAFSPPLIHYGSSSRLQLSANIYISILSPSQHSYSRINHFRFHFTNNELKKNKLNNIIIKITILTNLKYGTW
jgi:hypothetical protein